MTEKHEVQTKLTLDDVASEALERVKHGFEHVGEKVHEVQHELMAMAKQAVAVAIGFNLGGAIESVKELGEELFDSATHLERQKKELAGLISITDKGQDSMEELAGKATELNEKLEGLGIQTGATKEQMIDAFEMIAQRSSKSSEEIGDMVGKMSEAARVLPGGMETMAGAWRDLEGGIIRPKNALVQLMRQTHVAEGSAKQIAKALAGMVQEGRQEEVFKMGEEAIRRMAERAKKLPLTFDELLVSVKTIRESFFEAMGTPMVQAIAPELDHLREYLIGHRKEIEELAKTMGHKVGEWAKVAAEKMERAFEYLRTHADEIMNAIETGATALKDAISFLVSHKELIAGIFLGYKGSQGLGAVAGALPKMGALAGEIAGHLPTEMFGRSLTAGKAMAMTGAIAVIDVAVLDALGEQRQLLERESGMSLGEIGRSFIPGSHFGVGSMVQESDDLANFRAAAKALEDPTRQSADAIRETTRHINDFAQALSADGIGKEIQQEVDRMRDAANQKLQVANDLEAASKQLELTAVASYDSAFAGPTLALGERFQLVWNQMADMNESAAEDAARRILGGNDVLVEAIAGSGKSIADALEKLKAAHSAGAGVGSKMPSLNFGPTSIQIHQDFRNEDPDKIALIFRRDIAKQSVSRVGAKTGTPYGI